MRVWLAALGLLLGSSQAYPQHVFFTMLTPASSPLVISSVASSRDFGFQSLTLTNDSDKAIESVRLKVVLTVPKSSDEWVDGGRVFVHLEPGARQQIDAFLGRIRALTQRARELKLNLARAIVTVESVDFSDGTQWTGGPPTQDIPVQPLPDRR